MKLEQRKQWNKNAGAVLLLAMLYLLLMAMVAGTVIQSSILEFRMAGNDQFREEAFQKAQAIASAISENPDNFPVQGVVGQKMCKSTDADESCSGENFISVAPAVEALANGVLVEYQVERQGPLLVDSFPLRSLQRSSSSNVAYDAALFETRVVVDGSDVGQGRAEVVQGVAILIASSTQGRWE